MNLEIIYEDDTELAEYEALHKGYRGDIIVKIGNKKYKIYVTSMLRLRQDFATEQEDSGYYLSEPNTILVEETSKKKLKILSIECTSANIFKGLTIWDFNKKGLMPRILLCGVALSATPTSTASTCVQDTTA